MRHAQRIVAVIITALVAAVPAIVVSPAFRELVDSHPLLAAYYPLASAVVYAVYRARRPSTPAPGQLPPGAALKSVGSPTMGDRS